MKYVLITKAGKIMVFYILDVAMTYKTIYGGNIVLDTVEKIDEKV